MNEDDEFEEYNKCAKLIGHLADWKNKNDTN